MNPGDPSRLAPPLADNMAPAQDFPATVTPTFLAAELVEIRKHLASLRRHSDWLERQLAEIRAEQDPNVHPIRPAT